MPMVFGLGSLMPSLNFDMTETIQSVVTQRRMLQGIYPSEIRLLLKHPESEKQGRHLLLTFGTDRRPCSEKFRMSASHSSEADSISEDPCQDACDRLRYSI
jgi:hypothetical protein